MCREMPGAKKLSCAREYRMPGPGVSGGGPMRGWVRVCVSASWIVAATIASPGHAAENPSSPVIKPAPAFKAAQLNALPTTQWITNGGTLFNQRYSPLTLLNRDNVRGLKGL